MVPIKVLTIKYRFCASVDPVRYDSFDIKGPRSLEAMVEAHLASGSPYLELYVQFASPNDAFVTSTSTAIQEKYTTSARNSADGWQNMESSLFFNNMKYTTPGRDSVSAWDMHLGGSTFDTENTYWGTTSTTSDDSGSDDESDMNPPREPRLDGAEVALFSEPEPIPTIPKDVEGVSQDHPKMDLDMLANFILPTVKADPRTLVPVLIANIHSQLRYTPSYRKAWIAKKKVLEKMYGGSDASYNEVWQWCQVLERYVPYEINKDHFHEMLAVLRSVNKEGHNYLCNIPFEQWTQAYDNDLRYGQITLNLAECINFVLKGTRHLPITSVVRETYFRLAALFSKQTVRYKGEMQGGHVWYAKVLQEINKAKVQANTMHTVCHDHDNLWFHVTEFDRPNQGIVGGQYRVHLTNRTCDCGRFDALRYPCAHVIAACQNLRLDPMSYVDEVYNIEYMYNVWRHVFPPVPDEHKWSSVSLALFKLLSDKDLRRKPKGRPCSTRILPHRGHRQLHTGFLLVQVPERVLVALVGIVVHPTGDLIVGVGRMSHLDRIMTAEVFALPMAEVFESHKAMGIGKKKSSPTTSRATTAYRLEVDSE
ncbi:hypothetical protein GOBAR_AA25869 [Gossypium barbadense]|uniref:SWIM-type domain-containing protein n=1 Tax=Gossypium barbadense TaxID=3634 RepID=A0A2P5WUR0_GOSBA|nr:hypothetical protein GOBAR_AA25869 [Gossypium barbadense]